LVIRMKRRGVASPDIADALACTFASEHATLPVSPEWGRGDHLVQHEYDPFAPESANGPPRLPPRVYAEGWARLREDD